MPSPRRTRAYPELERVLITESAIRRRVRSLGREIMTAYGDEPITVIEGPSGVLPRYAPGERRAKRARSRRGAPSRA